MELTSRYFFLPNCIDFTYGQQVIEITDRKFKQKERGKKMANWTFIQFLDTQEIYNGTSARTSPFKQKKNYQMSEYQFKGYALTYIRK